MARNEEKQLARLNRWYLQKQRDEEAIKRPPRPKLNSLSTAEEVKKWIPTIIRDIDFYVKQMEVPCYPEHVITDFNRRIDHLKGEYKAFLRKLRELCPEEKSTPWSDRPYSPKRRKLAVDQQSVEEQCGTNSSENSACKKSSDPFIPLKTPVLDSNVEYGRFYGSLQTAAPPSQCDINDEHQNQPLDFLPIPKTNQRSTDTQAIMVSLVSKSNESSLINNSISALTDKSKVAQDIAESQNSVISSSSPMTVKDSSCFNVKEKSNSSNDMLVRSNIIMTPPPIIPSLNLPYTDSSSDESDEAT